MLGDFADQKGVVLPDSYLTYTSLNPGVAPIDPFGKVTGLANGTSIFTASHNNIQAVTAARVGEMPIPANDDEWNALLAEIYGLDVYPQAVTLTTGVKRSLLVGISGLTDSPDLKFGSVGTRYFVSNPNVLQVNSDGVITAVGEGIASVTVIDGAAEKVVPVRVKTPLMDPAVLGVDGGVVQGSDGSVVMVAPSALTHDTTVNLTPLSSEGLPLPFPDSMEFAGGFNLDLGNTPLNIPVQLAIPAPVGVPVGTEVLFMRKGSLPGEADSWNQTWLIQESGVVGADGMIRTTSPPFPGVTQSGTYTIGLLPAGMPSVSSIVNASTEENAGLINLSTNLYFENSYLGAQTGGIGAVSATENQFEATTSLLAYLAQSSNKPLEMIGIPKVGEPVITTAQVELNTEGVPTVSAVLSGPDTGLAVPLEPPSLESAELEFSNSEPVVFLTGSNFLNGLNGNLGDSFGDLKVDFSVGGKSYSGTVMPELSSSLGDNRYKVAVKAPISVPLGESEITLSRPQNERFGPGQLDSDVVKRSSFEDLQLEPVFSDLVLVAQRSSDKIRVIDALSSVSTPPSPQQQPPKDLSVGMPSVTDRPGQLAVTSNATRAYVPLERSGRVAMVDLLARREVDADASTTAVDDINLPNGASPGAISIDPWDNYAYIADSGRGSIYVLDVNPDSASYNQVVQTLSVNAKSGLRQIAISSDGRKLFATAADGYIYAVNIDPEDKPSEPNSNPRKWREQIGKVLTPTGAWGLAATPDPLKMVFTNGNPNTDGSGFGVLTVSDDPINLAPTTRYTNLTLSAQTNEGNVFEVNEGVAVTVTKDGRYAFVAGRNFRGNTGSYPLAGGNIGIIKDPLGPNPKLVAATQPVPGSLTNNVALSSDGKYLIGSYPTLGGGGNAYVFDVEEIIKTVENPAYALTTQGVEKFNPNIIPKGAIPAVIAIGGNPLGVAATKIDIAPAAIRYNNDKGYSAAGIKLIQQVVGAGQTGIFGADTVKKIVDWQSTHGLKRDGKVDSKTLWSIITELRMRNQLLDALLLTALFTAKVKTHQYLTDSGKTITIGYGSSGSSRRMSSGFNEKTFLESVKMSDKVKKLSDITTEYDCHGFTFLAGAEWINNGEVEKILKDNGYSVAQNPSVGDVVIYRDNQGLIQHSGIVAAVSGNTVTRVISKWSVYGLYEHNLKDVPASYGQKTTVYKSNRTSGNFPKGLGAGRPGNHLLRLR
ncbi:MULTISPECIES: peptidoglycan-binding protein [unclassified Microcoleus]|uniref:peptidoglycan-binding protein n=1 Tax=unclassified Microcoleus TaxID=2642155 RepID=UPI002FD5B332